MTLVSQKFVLQERRDATAILTLNRPERHNSLIPELLSELLESLSSIAADTSIRAVLLKANGRSFSTGGDVQEFMRHADTPDRLEHYARALVGLLNETILALMNFPAPVIACVHGIVTGGSLGLVLASDIALLTPEASFTPFYATVGFSPDGGWGALLPCIIGIKRTAEILFADTTLTAMNALALGLANRIVPREELENEALALATTIAQKQADSVTSAKRLLHRDIAAIATALEDERSRFVEHILTNEARSGMERFLAAKNKAAKNKAAKNK